MGWLFLLLWLLGAMSQPTGIPSDSRGEGTPMNQHALECVMQLLPNGDGETSFTFEIENSTANPVTIRYFQPFTSFDLAVTAIDGAVPVIQPRFDRPAMPQTLTLAPGERGRINTPITLAFDPFATPAGGNVPTRWLLRHDPIPVRLQATLHLDGVAIEPCENYWDPEG